ncbi:hypothetical protein EVAR_46012_1 [Eumeta japonica]|uniref:Uncharacterized protein n=1 Tax=Eumeta variegata TaxID=151549 RepID=A0A4C1XB63_EUMVA|nr:hypothetical protein EVAR_46012_1 [Eumeta japonica]
MFSRNACANDKLSMWARPTQNAAQIFADTHHVLQGSGRTLGLPQQKNSDYESDIESESIFKRSEGGDFLILPDLKSRKRTDGYPAVKEESLEKKNNGNPNEKGSLLSRG